MALTPSCAQRLQGTDRQQLPEAVHRGSQNKTTMKKLSCSTLEAGNTAGFQPQTTPETLCRKQGHFWIFPYPLPALHTMPGPVERDAFHT